MVHFDKSSIIMFTKFINMPIYTYSMCVSVLLWVWYYIDFNHSHHIRERVLNDSKANTVNRIFECLMIFVLYNVCNFLFFAKIFFSMCACIMVMLPIGCSISVFISFESFIVFKKSIWHHVQLFKERKNNQNHISVKRLGFSAEIRWVIQLSMNEYVSNGSFLSLSLFRTDANQ